MVLRATPTLVGILVRRGRWNFLRSGEQDILFIRWLYYRTKSMYIFCYNRRTQQRNWSSLRSYYMRRESHEHEWSLECSYSDRLTAFLSGSYGHRTWPITRMALASVSSMLILVFSMIPVSVRQGGPPTSRTSIELILRQFQLPFHPTTLLRLRDLLALPPRALAMRKTKAVW